MPSISAFPKRPSLVLAILAALVLGAAAPAAASVIEVEGVSRAEAEVIRSYFAGTSSEEVEAGLQALRASGRFTSVAATRSGDHIVVRVAAGRIIINRVVFEGNSKVKTENLEPEVRTKSQGAFSAATADQDAARITEIYRRSGRAAARVTYRTVELPNGRVDVVFTVAEGDKTGVREIRFVGNDVYSTGRLVGLMETTEMNYLSFFKTSDVYDPDRVASDLELVRRFYLKNGYADFHVVNSEANYDPVQQGYILVITVSEGPQYRVSAVDMESHLPDIDAEALRPFVRVAPGDVYNGDAVEKSVEALTREVARKGYAFTQARPRGERNPVERTVSIRFVLDEGPRVYIERINIRGNTNTREYVIRREFEIGEGDAYNRVLIDRAERHLNALGFFKKVKITNEPGSAPDRVVINVEVEDQPTGNFSVSGGYSTTEGFIGEVSVSNNNFLGRGEAVRLALNEGQRSRGVNFSFTEPYFLDQRMSGGFDVFARKSDAWNYSYYSTTSYGTTLRLGVPITEEISFSPHYSVYATEISIPNDSQHPYNDCQSPLPGYTPGFGYIFAPTPGSQNIIYNCLNNGEASLAIKESQGTRLTSALGYTVGFSSLDNMRNPKNGETATFTQDVAGLGGDTRYLRSSGDARYYYEVPYLSDVVAIGRIQGGNLTPIAGYSPRVFDNFNLGPSLVRGFAPGGIGPRDLSNFESVKGNSLGGTQYIGATVEVQFPIWGIPKDIGLRGALFTDAGSLWDYQGTRNFSKNLFGIPNLPCVYPYTPPTFGQGTCLLTAPLQTVLFNLPGSDTSAFRMRQSVGASLLWQSPLGPIRFDYAVATVKGPYDVTQRFRFSGGTSF
ncbi:MAG TPA: outer membrane protein assembly factor BamA [Methylocystis sp.]|nr:outer membrane protein assembly factor BamA [Methylocystis sp.]